MQREGHTTKERQTSIASPKNKASIINNWLIPYIRAIHLYIYIFFVYIYIYIFFVYIYIYTCFICSNKVQSKATKSGGSCDM